jgi:hypothetical protein
MDPREADVDIIRDAISMLVEAVSSPPLKGR